MASGQVKQVKGVRIVKLNSKYGHVFAYMYIYKYAYIVIITSIYSYLEGHLCSWITGKLIGNELIKWTGETYPWIDKEKQRFQGWVGEGKIDAKLVHTQESGRANNPREKWNSDLFLESSNMKKMLEMRTGSWNMTLNRFSINFFKLQ